MKTSPLNLVIALTVLFFVIWLIPFPNLFDNVEIMPLWSHIVAEFFAITVSFLVFSIGWHSYDEEQSSNSTILACGFLAIGLLDQCH